MRRAEVGAQRRAGRQVDVALRADRIDRAVALLGDRGVVEQRVDGLIALQIDDAQDLPALHGADPRLAGRDDLIAHAARPCWRHRSCEETSSRCYESRARSPRSARGTDRARARARTHQARSRTGRGW